MSNRTEAAWRKLRHCHREATVTAPLLDSTHNRMVCNRLVSVEKVRQQKVFSAASMPCRLFPVRSAKGWLAAAVSLVGRGTARVA